MKINWAAIIFIALVLVFVVGIVMMCVDDNKIVKQMKLFCEDVGGKYEHKDCMIKENGYYQKYDINWEWNEKGVREFFLIRE